MAASVVAESGTRAVVERLLHDVIAGLGPAPLEEVVADEGLRQHVRALLRAFGPLEVTPHVLVVAGAHAAVSFTARGTHRDWFQGVPATGREWTAGCTAVYRVEDARIADAWVTWDRLAILEQVGGLRRRPGSSA